MPTSNWQNIGESIELIRKWMPGSVLDVGCGFGRWGFVCREFLDVWEGRAFKHEWKVRIEGIEGFEPYLSPVHRHLYDRVHVGNAKDVLPGLGTFDLIILGDVLEHFGRDDALAFLATCRAHLTPAGHVLVHIPLGEEWEQGDGPGGNVLERHLSAWTLDELKELGADHASLYRDPSGREFAVVVYGHQEMTAEPPARERGGDPERRELAIAFATQEWPSAGRVAGGSGRYVHATARALARRGHVVHVVTCAHAGLPATTTEDGVAVHRIAEAAPNAKDPASLARYARAVAKKIRELDAQHAFDVVETPDWAAEGWAFHPRRNQALVVNMAAPSHFVRGFEYADGTAAERRVDEMERWPLERADLVTAPSRKIVETVAKSWAIDPARVAVIPCGVDTNAFRASPAPNVGRAPLVLCVNRLTPIKGPEIFVRAAAIVHRDFPAARFRMVGRVESWDGEPGDQKLRTLATSLGLPADRLEIAGPVSHDELPAEYSAADVCVNPSLGESFSLTSAEALACGRPCVLSDAMGITEILTDGTDAMIARSGDPESFARAISKLLGDTALRERMGAPARRVVASRCSTDVTVRETEAAYRRAVVAARARAPLPRTKLVVAILTYNALEFTKRCLASIARHTNVPHHVFVLDNASTDGSREWLAGVSDGRVHVTLGDRNLGVPAGRNALIRTALPTLRDDSVLVFLDNDVEVGERWYEPIFAALDSDPRAGIAGEAGHPITVGAELRTLLPAPPRHPAPVDVVSGFCFAVKAACAREVGLFDEKLGLFWHEDDDYCIRAIMLGWNVIGLRARRLVHHEHKSGVAVANFEPPASIANQKYLAAKWRALGMVDSASGRILRQKDHATLALRARVAARLRRDEAICPEELDRAARDLADLLMSKDIVRHVERRHTDLSPALRALLDLQIEDARAQSNAALVAALEGVRAVTDKCRLSSLLRQHMSETTPPATPSRAPRRLSKVCDANDWDTPEWRELCLGTFGESSSRNWYSRHRKLWESGQVMYALRHLVPDLASAHGIVVNAGCEPVVFGLANAARTVMAVDAWGDAPEAPETMLADPGRFAPVPFRRNKLVVAKMSATALGLPDDGLDFAVICALHRLRTEDAAAAALAECARVVRPGGCVIAVTEVGLNGHARPGFFVPEQLSRITASCGLAPVEEMDYSVTDATLDGFVDLSAGPDRRPHLVLARGDMLFTSGVLALERRAADAVATEQAAR
jgi:glycosyltransferase involved in cell wall biosynthesis/GT2 family glycosyltransferase/SAM-dependent methyltransferase